MAVPSAPVDPLFLSFQLALAGRYSIDRELGRGGMGIVYLAREVHLDRMVAIKLLPPDKASDQSLRDRFLREARLAAKLSHPNVIPIHAVDAAHGFVYYVMAFIDGETLAQRVRTRGPLNSSEGARVLREVAWALGHAHSHGLVHRDVKPDNILLEYSTGRVLVADFGIAAATQDATGAGVSGTPEFMSPEQALGKDVDARSDLYALGVTAFYAFSGRLPFEGQTPTEVLAKHVTEPAPLLSSMGVPVARKIALLVDRCVAKDPDQRPASADALAEQLGVALEQRRELPAALRAFVKSTGRLNGGGTLILPFALLGVAGTLASFSGLAAGYATMAVGAVTLPMAYLVASARKLLRLGFAHADLAPAFAAEIEQSRDERAVGYVRGAAIAERVLLRTIQVLWPVFGISMATALAYVTKLMPEYVFGSLAKYVELGVMAGIPAGPATLAYLVLLERRSDVDTAFWSKLWTGPIGKVAFAIAKRFLGRGARATAVTHRATELSLGMAAESLFESLPAETRRSLGDVLSVVRRLQEDAQRLRKLHDELNEALASIGDGASDDHDALRTERDRAHAKLGAAVGSLENIRLNLLRLHAGSGSVEGFTTHLDLAAEVSAEVERLLAARDEVERGLVFPRDVATTPA